MPASPFHAIADPTRRQILDVLMRGPQRAGDLAVRFPRISRPAVSKHLRVLRSSRLVLQKQHGREIWYQLNPMPLDQVQGWLESYRGFWQERMQALKDSVEKE